VIIGIPREIFPGERRVASRAWCRPSPRQSRLRGDRRNRRRLGQLRSRVGRSRTLDDQIPESHLLRLMPARDRE